MSTEKIFLTLVGIGIILTVCSAFRWLYKRVTDDKIGWFDSFYYVILPGVVRNILSRIFNKLDLDQPLLEIAVGFCIWLGVTYSMLRIWHKQPKKQAITMTVLWFPVVMAVLISIILTTKLD